MKKFIKIAACLFALAIIAGNMVSCSNPPALDDVKDEFIALIEASVEVNNIFFGEGLPTYMRAEGDGNLIYLAEHKAYYTFITDGERSILKYKIGDDAWKYAEKTARASRCRQVACHTDGVGQRSKKKYQIQLLGTCLCWLQ